MQTLESATGGSCGGQGQGFRWQGFRWHSSPSGPRHAQCGGGQERRKGERQACHGQAVHAGRRTYVQFWSQTGGTGRIMEAGGVGTLTSTPPPGVPYQTGGPQSMGESAPACKQLALLCSLMPGLTGVTLKPAPRPSGWWSQQKAVMAARPPIVTMVPPTATRKEIVNSMRAVSCKGGRAVSEPCK